MILIESKESHNSKKERIDTSQFEVKNNFQYPYCYIGIIKAGNKTGSGCLISNNCVLTTAHLFYNDKNEKISMNQIKFYSSKKAFHRGFGPISAQEVFVSEHYDPTANQTRISDNDWAILSLEKPIGLLIKEFCGKDFNCLSENITRDNILSKNHIQVIGYPSSEIGDHSEKTEKLFEAKGTVNERFAYHHRSQWR